ncbi:hypothetical protein ACJJTC_009575 [Scirpophaga incertulas]
MRTHCCVSARELCVSRAQHSQQQHAGGVLRDLAPGEPVWARSFRQPDKWLKGTVANHQGTNRYVVNSGDGRLIPRHIDQIRRRSRMSNVPCPSGTNSDQFEGQVSIGSEDALADSNIPDVGSNDDVAQAISVTKSNSEISVPKPVEDPSEPTCTPVWLTILRATRKTISWRTTRTSIRILLGCGGVCGFKMCTRLRRNEPSLFFPNSLIEYWANAITNTFNNECYEIWAGWTKRKSRQSAAGRGILLMRYYNVRRKLNKCGLTKVNAWKNVEQQEDLIIWLENNTRSVNEVITNWKLTSKKRLSKLIKEDLQFHDYMEKFGALKRPDGHKLLEADFEFLYPDSAMQFYSQWPTLSTFLMEKAGIKEKQAVDDICTPDGKKTATLRILPTLLPMKNVIKKNKKQWSPSKLESKNGLIQYVKSFADIQIAVNQKCNKFLEYGLNLGPSLFAVSVGNDTITEYYIVINNYTYKTDFF